MSAFDLLHPAIQHHIVNSLGWRSLRPLQEQAIEPVLAGQNALLLAPTAGGKTEAAVFPVLSRMLHEDWSGLSVLYLCPIKALLNNLEPRLERYCSLVGRRTGLWHGDVPEGARNRIRLDPPDLLLTTPESLEVMLVSQKTDHRTLFRGLRCIIVDEIHAFAGDDRGWHLLSVAERVGRLADGEVQRLGLSATIGNPDELLSWLSPLANVPRRVIAPGTEDAQVPEIKVDYVGNLENAATLISRLHGGEKRLVFVDSRSRVEMLATLLREREVKTFVSHSSLGLDERRQAEKAFAESSDCVIVATSTLELGIDVGDLDRVIQIDAPATVASFLQRLGRTGRRPGTKRNCLFVATSEDALLRTCGLLRLWSRDYVEPIVPPSVPYHILAQQIMALSLQERGIGRYTWWEWLEHMPGFQDIEGEEKEQILTFMLDRDILFEDQGLLSMGTEGVVSFGRRHFMELMSVFTSEPLFAVRHGRRELGHVHQLSFQVRQEAQPILSLAGRSWQVTHIDWPDRVAFVEPTKDRGKSQWLGEAQPLRFEFCQAVRDVLTDGPAGGELTARARDALNEIREELSWLTGEDTWIVTTSIGSRRWWTFAGIRANAILAQFLGPLSRENARIGNLYLELSEKADPGDVRRAILDADVNELDVPFTDEAVEGLKFSSCLPLVICHSMLRARLADSGSVATVLGRKPRIINL